MDELHEQASVTLWLDDPVLQQCYSIRVPGQVAEEGHAFLRQLDSAAAGAGARQFLAGATWGPIRKRYQMVDRALAEAAQARLAQLGASPKLADLEAIVREASSKRSLAARVWRMPSGPDAFVAAEMRDWKKYGFGGRSFNNLMDRSMANPARATWAREDHLKQILRNVEKTNPAVDAAVLRNARYLKAGGAILMIAGAGWTLHEYSQTPDSQKAEFVRRESASFAGSALATGVVTAVLVTMSVSGAIVIGAGLVAGVAGGLLAEGVYRSLYGKTLLGQIKGSGVIQSHLIDLPR